MIITHSTIDKSTIGYDIYNVETPFVLNSSIRFWVYESTNAYKITIPKNFRSDGASVTFLLAKLIVGCEHNPLFFPAVLLHDYMCRQKEKYRRELASRAMLHLLLKRGVPEWKAYLMYYSVELYMKYWRNWK